MRKSSPRRLLRPPFRRPILTVGIFFLFYLILIIFQGGFSAKSDQILMDLLLGMISLFFWLLFFAQFTLPLKHIQERKEASIRLLYYILGRAGPVVRVENGEIKERKGESSRSGPGVVILDTASAAVIRDPTQFISSVGPGVYFTQYHQSIAGTVDLHLQTESVGPIESEDPFAPQSQDETEAAYKARQARRFATQGLTRDGIEVVPRINVVVRLDTDQNQGNTRFGYNSLAVERAVKGMPVDLGAATDAPTKTVNLTWLPLHLAADICKEALSHYTLEDLFANEPGKVTALQLIIDHIKSRMTKPEYQEFDSFGRSNSTWQRSKEYEMLKNRGIRVIAASVYFLKFPKSVEDRLVEMWKSTWLLRAQQERKYVDYLRSYETERGKRSAVGLYARGASHYLGSQNLSLRLTGEQVLRQLIRGTLYLSNQEYNLHSQAADEIEQLKELLEWSEQRPAP